MLNQQEYKKMYELEERLSEIRQKKAEAYYKRTNKKPGLEFLLCSNENKTTEEEKEIHKILFPLIEKRDAHLENI